METSPFQSVKLIVGAMFSLSKDALHIYVGLFVFLTVSYLVRKRYHAAWALLAVFLVACLGEIFDARDNFASLGRWRWRASLHDIMNTMFWPIVLSVLIRLRVIALDGRDRP
jgi:hypothetical protein